MSFLSELVGKTDNKSSNLVCYNKADSSYLAVIPAPATTGCYTMRDTFGPINLIDHCAVLKPTTGINNILDVVISPKIQ